MGSTATGRNDVDRGLYYESHLRPSIEAELAWSRRFGRGFALVLIGVDAMRLRYDYRFEEAWQAGLTATARLLQGTRNNVDRVFRYGPSTFAMILPESGEHEIMGMIRRLRREAREMSAGEGEPGGPLPVHFGATFFPTRATSVSDLLERAEVAMRIAEKTPSRVQIDGAAAPEMPAPETLRQTGAGEPSPLHLLMTTTAPIYPPDAPAVLVDFPSPGIEAIEAAEEAVPALVGAAYSANLEASEQGPLNDTLSVALKQLDQTLVLIRTIRRQAA